jgi:hypothetical protein
MSLLFRRTNLVLVKVVPIVVVVVALKLLVHRLEWEFIPLNAVFSGIIGATVFLLGFLLSGVLSDYKESEKIPGDLAAILLTMADEMESAWKSKQSPAARTGLSAVGELGQATFDWIHRRIRTQELQQRIAGLNDHFLALEPVVPVNYIARLKQEQHAYRKLIIRVHTIRETDFVSSAYLIGTSTSVLLVLGLVLSRLEPFYDSLFFVGVISYLLSFLLVLIRDLDNPFGHSERGSHEDVSLKPLEDARGEVAGRIETLGGAAGSG